MAFLRTLTTVAGTAVLAACSSSNPSAGASAPTPQASATPAAVAIADPCKLLTQDEASAALGKRTGPGELKQFGTITTRCSFYSPSTQEELFLDVSNPGLFDAATHLGATPVAGIGDKALWQYDAHSSFLFIEKGGKVINLGGLPGGMATPSPAVQQAGKLVASRM